MRKVVLPVLFSALVGAFVILGAACSKSNSAAATSASANPYAAGAPTAQNTVRPGAPGQPTQTIPAQQ
ncbi:MAG: hypothetical protein ACRD1Y_13740 [Terriglobales bacterium]